MDELDTRIEKEQLLSDNRKQVDWLMNPHLEHNHTPSDTCFLGLLRHHRGKEVMIEIAWAVKPKDFSL